MPLSTATITFDLADHFGVDYDTRRGIRAWVDTNITDDTVVDTDGNKVRIGSGKVTVNADGTGSFTVWVPGTGSNPASWQTRVHFEYVPNGNPKAGRTTRTFGPFTVTGNADLADLIAEQEVPPTYLSVVTDLLDGYVAEAQAARDEAVDISGISTSDAVIASRITTPGTATETALTATFAPGGVERGGIVSALAYPNTQAAIDALAAYGGGTVVLPPGPTYVGNAGLHVRSRVTLAGPHCGHTTSQLVEKDSSGYYRPQGINPTTGLARYAGAYLVPEAGSTGPMVWTSDYDYSWVIRDLAIFGVDVYGEDIPAPAKPAWTSKLTWTDATATVTSGSTTVTLSADKQAVQQMVGKTITGDGIPAGATVTGYNNAANTITLSAAATSNAPGVIVSGGPSGGPVMSINGRPGISTGAGTGRFRARGRIDNVLAWGCGSGGVGATANNRTWAVTGAVTNGSNLVTLTTQPDPKMIPAPISGTGIPAGTTVIAIDPGPGNVVVLSQNATATGGSTALTIGGTTFTNALQQVYAGTPGVYIGAAETMVRDLLVFMSGGDGLVIDNQDCELDLAILAGWNNGWGVRTCLNSGPLRGLGAAIDSFGNGFYGGAGNFLIEGAGHTFGVLHANSSGQQGVKFGRCVETTIAFLNATEAGQYWASSGTRYPTVEFASPASSSSNPVWATGSNSDVKILAGQVTDTLGFASNLIKDNAAVVGYPQLGVKLLGHIWNGATQGNSLFEQVPGYSTNFRPFGSFSMPDRLMGAQGLPPFVTLAGANDGLVMQTGGGVAVSGFGSGGAIFHRTNSQALATNGAVTLNANTSDHHFVTLNANATSSSITNPKLGQMMTIEWIQGAGGSRTYVWPTNCKFAGGAAPTASTTAGWSDSVTFRYDGTNWREVGRSPAIR